MQLEMKNKLRSFFKREWILLILFFIPSIYYLVLPGFYEPHDLHHFADIYQMYKAFESGQLPPRLGPDFSWEYGYPLFNYYYVLPFYIGAFWFWITGSLISSFKFVFIITLVLSFLGMFLLLRKFFEINASFAGAFLFVYTPYRAVQIYVRGAMGEALALAFLPFVFWAIKRLIEKPESENIVILSLILALFILSHNYIWLLSLVFIGSFALLELFRIKNKIKSLVSLVKSFFLGVGLSFYWWFPAISEKHIFPSRTHFLLEDHFPFFKQLIIPSWGYGASVWGSGDSLSFQIGFVNLAVFIISLLFLVVNRRLLKEKSIRNLITIAILGFLLALFFMNIRSLPFWKLLPIYQMVQFPWRLLFLTTFFTGILGAFVAESLPGKTNLWSAFLIIFLSLGLTFSYFKPSKITYKKDDQYLKTFFAREEISGKSGSVSEEYKNYSEDYLLMPDWVVKRPNSLPSFKIETEADIIRLTKTSSVDWRVIVQSEKPTQVIFNSHYFPGWYAKVDGIEKSIKVMEPYGQIAVDINSGVHEVRFFWKETPLRKFVDFMSILSFFVVLLITLRKKFNLDLF